MIQMSIMCNNICINKVLPKPAMHGVKYSITKTQTCILYKVVIPVPGKAAAQNCNPASTIVHQLIRLSTTYLFERRK